MTRKKKYPPLKYFIHAAPLLLLIVTIAVYQPGLRGPFVLDDVENIQHPALKIKTLDVHNLSAAARSGDSGPLGRPLASISFALNHYFAGSDAAFSFKLVNLIIHLINALLLYRLALLLAATPAVRRLLPETMAPVLALTATAFWTLHPIQLTNVLYVVQRMNSLSALFVIAGLILFMHGRRVIDTDPNRGITLITTGLVGGTLLGAAAKENAILMPLFVLCIEYTLLRETAPNVDTRLRLGRLYSILILLPVVLAVSYVASHPDVIASSYLTRDFSPMQRLLTETRALWFYAGLIVLPTLHRFGLFHDDIVLSTGLLTPPVTLLAVACLVVTIAAAIAFNRRYAVLSFGLLWYLAGHALESGIIGLEPVYEHRNYLPSFGLLFALACGLLVLLRRGTLKRWTIPAVSGVALALGANTYALAHKWADLHTLTQFTVATHPLSARANNMAARVSLALDHDLTAAIRYTLAGLGAAPQETGFMLDLRMLLAELSAQAAKDPVIRAQRGKFTFEIPGLDAPLSALNTQRGLEISPASPDTASDETITHLLTERPISVHALTSLETLRRCLLEAGKPCARLRSHALPWFVAGAGNPRTAPTYRGILENDLAMLYADSGRLEDAVQHMERAVTALPAHLPYRIRLADYRIRTGRREQALELIKAIEVDLQSQPASAADYENQISALRARLNRKPRQS